MAKNKHSKTGRTFFILSIAVFIFWLSGSVINIYRYAFVGAIFELLWLPMIASLVVMPVLVFVYWMKEKFSTGSLYFYSLLVLVAAILAIIFLKPA